MGNTYKEKIQLATKGIERSKKAIESYTKKLDSNLIIISLLV